MIVYVESNFVLELSLVQSQFTAANAILEFAKSQRLVLAFPAFAIFEPYSTIISRWIRRSSLTEQLTLELGQISRSGLQEQQSLANSLSPLLSNFTQLRAIDLSLYEQVISSLLSVGKSIELTHQSFNNALIYRDSLAISYPDALIYASILSDLAKQDLSEPKCFLSRDQRAFFSSQVRDELNRYNCRYINNFVQGQQFIEAELNKNAQANPNVENDASSG